MIVYLVRHGADDNSIRGGWSNHGLTEEGRKQSEDLALRLLNSNCGAEIIYASDLLRAKQTAEALANSLHLPVQYTADFREVNNGDLAGMDNEMANALYPNFYWRKLGWDQHYPNGESPKEFYERIKDGWKRLTKKNHKSLILVTHGGVIQVILHLFNNAAYSNKSDLYRIGTAEYIRIEME